MDDHSLWCDAMPKWLRDTEHDVTMVWSNDEQLTLESFVHGNINSGEIADYLATSR